MLVGSKDRVRLYNILQDKLKYFRETVQKSCRELRFSNGCQYWAGACAMTIVIYDTATFTQLVLFQGHMMAIRNLVWAPGDQVEECKCCNMLSTIIFRLIKSFVHTCPFIS